MKQLILGLFLIAGVIAKGQNVCHGAVISTVYNDSRYFEVIDVDHRLDFSVYRDKKEHFIQTTTDSFRVEKRGILYHGNTLIAEYVKETLVFPSGKRIIEQRINDGWEYRLDDRVILTVYFSLDRANDTYFLCFDAKEWNEETKFTAFIASARFTKSVPMTHFSITGEDMLEILVDVLYFLSI